MPRLARMTVCPQARGFRIPRPLAAGRSGGGLPRRCLSRADLVGLHRRIIDRGSRWSHDHCENRIATGTRERRRLCGTELAHVEQRPVVASVNPRSAMSSVPLPQRTSRYWPRIVGGVWRDQPLMSHHLTQTASSVRFAFAGMPTGQPTPPTAKPSCDRTCPSRSCERL
jgi:hypothetical protein